MGNGPTFRATYIGQDGLPAHELGRSYLIEVDVDGAGRLFVDITELVARVKDGTLPKTGEYLLDQSDDWWDKHYDEPDPPTSLNEDGLPKPRPNPTPTSA
jgi:hypothetical protein